MARLDAAETATGSEGGLKGSEPGVRLAETRTDDEDARQALRMVAEARLREPAESDTGVGGIGGAGEVQRRSSR